MYLTKSWLAASLTTLTIGLGLGCADDKPDPTGISTAESEMRPLVDAACTWMFGCCSEGELTYQLGDFTLDANDCSDRMVDAIKTGEPLAVIQGDLSSDYASGLLLLALSINEGRVKVNNEAVQACAAATTERACNELIVVEPGERCTPAAAAPDDPCDRELMFDGRQIVGEPCDAPWECVEGLRCIPFGASSVCAPAALIDENCFTDAECADGLVCGWATGTCTVGAKTGETCAYADPSQPIPGTETIRCDVDLACDPISATCAGGTCTPGAPCNDVSGDTDCPSGTFCFGDFDADPTCRAAASTGEYCDRDAQCVTSYCDPNMQLCATLAITGTECFDDVACESGFCDLNLCTDTVLPGQPCPTFSDAQCRAGYCDPTGFEALCTAYQNAGGMCVSTTECNPEGDLVCVEGTCLQPPFDLGTACFSNAQCTSEVCFTGECVAGTPAGGPCNFDGTLAPCQVGSYCDLATPDALSGTCDELRRPGESCERSDQCWGDCVVRYGETICDATAAFGLDELWCDG